jgi:hypothetical protein
MAQTAMTVHLDNDSVREQAKAAFMGLKTKRIFKRDEET